MTCIKCHHETVKNFGFNRNRTRRYRCSTCSVTFSEPAPVSASPLGNMRIDESKALQAIHCLLEGCSIRSTERLTGLHRDTIMSLLVVAGQKCAELLAEKMQSLKLKHVQCDEIWTFCFKKQKHVRRDDPEEFGDQWFFIAIDEE